MGTVPIPDPPLTLGQLEALMRDYDRLRREAAERDESGVTDAIRKTAETCARIAEDDPSVPAGDSHDVRHAIARLIRAQYGVAPSRP